MDSAAQPDVMPTDVVVSPAAAPSPGGPGAVPSVPAPAVPLAATGSVTAPMAPAPGDPNVPDPDPVDPIPTPAVPSPDATLPAAPDPAPSVPAPVDPTDPSTPAPTAGSQCEGGALAPGFYVQDGRIYDNHCGEFVMRGVNYPHVWYKDSQSTEQMFQDIAATGANTVRVVLATGGQWTRIGGSEVAEIISWGKANQLVLMLEVHDATGYGDKAEAVHPDEAVDYWLSDDIKSAITGEEAFVMINIANEPFGNDASDQWEPFHASAVAALRAAGLKHLFIVDAPNWGQDWSNTMRDGIGASNIFSADPDENTAFSVHMYDVYNTSELVWSYFENFLGSGMALLVGEFAADHGPGKDVDEATILAASKEHRIGYLGWSWSGNSSDLSSLDLVQDFNASAYSPWGQRLIDGADGIRETSVLCACFE